MKKFQILLSTFATIVITVICMTFINTNTAKANVGQDYEEIIYYCQPGNEQITRCNYGSGSCDVEGQELCPGEGGDPGTSG